LAAAAAAAVGPLDRVRGGPPAGAGSARLGRDPAAGGRRHRISDKHFAVPDGTLLEPRAANEEQMSAKRRTIARVNDVCVASW